MSENASEPGAPTNDASASKPNAQAAPAPESAPAAQAPAEATTRLVLVPDAITESFTAFVPDLGQFRIDKNGVDVPTDAVEAILENAEAHGFVVKEA